MGKFTKNILNSLNTEAIQKINDVESVNLTYLRPSEIVPNSLNECFSITGIDELKENILKIGLTQPLVVVKAEDDKYRIISGERRYTALKAIIDEGKEFHFLSKNLTDRIPCIINATYEYIDDEEEALIGSNSVREMSKKDRLLVAKKCANLYERLEKQGRRPKGRKREYIAELMGVSDRSVQTYLKEIEKENITKTVEDIIEEEELLENKRKSKALKKLRKIKDNLNEIDLMPEEVDQDILSELISIRSITKVLLSDVDYKGME